MTRLMSPTAASSLGSRARLWAAAAKVKAKPTLSQPRNFVFSNPETFEEVTVSPELVGEAKDYLMENGSVTMTFVEDKAVEIEVPASVVLTVKDAPEGIRGDSANNVQKLITLETGKQINAPLFIKTGERIKVDTRTGKYMERA